MTTSISSFSVSEALRATVLRKQAALDKAQTEISTGLTADAGLALGSRTGQLVSLERQSTSLQGLLDSNKLVSSRLDATSTALTNLSDTATSFRQSLISALSDPSSSNSIAASASSALQSLSAALGTSSQGAYVFGGINSGTAPLTDYYSSSGSSARNAVASAFQSAFGMSQTDQNVSSISASDMQTFLDGAYSDLFDDSGWSANWSSASDTAQTATIADGQTAKVSVSANETALRKLAMAYTMVSDLGAGNMSEDTRQVVLNKASSILSEAMSGLTDIQSTLGTTQSRVTTASTNIQAQQTILTSATENLNGVDSYEASTRLSALKTQLETAYSLTSQLQNLSLVQYL